MSVNFQDEAEVKQYLDNIGIEYRFGCYSEKKPDGMEFNNIVDDRITKIKFIVLCAFHLHFVLYTFSLSFAW